MIKKYSSIDEVLSKICGYSDFLQQRLEACIEAAEDGYYYLSVSTLMGLLEDSLKLALDDFEENFNILAETAYEQNILTDIEYAFISFDDNSLRKFRNCIAHKNLATLYLQFSYEELLYPCSEEDTYQHFYDKYADIIINIILKIITRNNKYEICLDSLLKNNAFRILSFSIPDLLELKGYPRDYADKLNMAKSDIIRLIDNSSDAHVIKALLNSNLKVDDSTKK